MSSSDKFVNYRLCRTSPKLSGNLKLDLVLRNNLISGIYLRPLSDRIPYAASTDQRPWKNTHSYNLREFYKKTKGHFYTSPTRPELESDWPIILRPQNPQELKYLKDWDDTYWAGTRRMSHRLYGTTHECLVPLWLEDTSKGLSLELRLKNNSNTVLSIPISIDGSGLTSYLTDYLSVAELDKGNNKIIGFDKNTLRASLRGVSVLSGELVSRQSTTLLKNLIYRERPVLEQDSLLCSVFQDYEMIIPQLLNLNICLDLDELLPSFLSTDQFYDFQLEVSAYIGRTELRCADLFTNSEYIPRKQINQVSYGPDSEPLNVLSYMIDNQISEFINKNKIVQPICHWQYIESPDKLFNMYSGFGPYTIRDGGSVITYRGYNNTVIDTVRDTYDPESGDTGLFIAQSGTEADLIDHLYNPEPHIESGFYVDLKKTLGDDVAFYTSAADSFTPDHIWAGAMTSPSEIDGSMVWGPMQTTITSPAAIGILTARYNKKGEMDLSESLRYASEADKKYNIFRYSDIDNRFGNPNIREIARHTPNKYALYVCMNRVGNNIYIIFWTHMIVLSDSDSNDILYHSYLPDSLTLNGLNNAINGYKAAVAQIKGYDPDTAQGQTRLRNTLFDVLGPTAGLLYIIDKISSSFAAPNNIFITKTLSVRPDRSLNNRQKEGEYYKYNNGSGLTLYRDLGYIRPAIYEYPGSRDENAVLHWTTNYGRNWFYRKRVILGPESQDAGFGEYFDNTEFNRFYAEQIPPRSPSQGYTGVLNARYTGNPDGDLLTTETWPRLLGKWPPSLQSSVGPWEEYKWFDLSTIKSFPVSWTGHFDIRRDLTGDDHISKLEFDKAFNDALYSTNSTIKNRLFESAPLLTRTDSYYIRQIYDFRFDLEDYKNNIFTYKVSAELK